MKFRIAGGDLLSRGASSTFTRQLKAIIDRESRDRSRSAEDEWQEDTDHRCGQLDPKRRRRTTLDRSGGSSNLKLNGPLQGASDRAPRST